MIPDLQCKIGKLKLSNPVMVASGTYGYGEEMADFFNPAKIGAIVTKTITPLPRAGNEPTRICETPSGMINSIGLANKGIDYFLKANIPYLAKLKTKKIVSISADTDQAFLMMVQKLTKAKGKGVDALELNLSCPNLDKKVLIAQDPKATYRIIKKVKRATSLPIIAKLSPNVIDIKVIAKACEKGGADGISLINTLYGMAIDIDKKCSKIGNTFGGLSGPAIKPVALKMVWDVSNTVKTPVIAIGGISNALDAAEFFLAGASGIQIGTANYLNPLAAPETVTGIKEYMQKYGFKKISDIHKSFKPKPILK